MPSKRKVAFLVDGKCELAIYDKLDQTNHIFGFIKRYKNGREVSAEAIANECIELLKTSGRLYQTCVIIVDREDRNVNIAEFERDIRARISQVYTGSYELVCSNQMFENWIVADIENVSAKNMDLLRGSNNDVMNEGKHGAGILEGLWVKKPDGTRYGTNKAGHSKRLFKNVRPDIARGFSDSFRNFHDILVRNKIKMYWL